jgi:SpoIID/LytB domain protein
MATRSRIIALTLTAIFAMAPAMPATADPADPVTFTGSGWGHGVGMSQYGARGMAAEGRSAAQILPHYYSGSTLAPVANALGSGHWLVAEPEPLWVNLLQNRTLTTLQAVGGSLTVCQNEPVGMVLRLGMAPSSYVKVLEQRLAALGHFGGQPDEVFDTDTDAAVRAFQTSAGIRVDGVVGGETAAKLWPKDGAGENCFFQTVIADQAIAAVSAVGNRNCTISGMPAAGSCTASVRGLSTTARVVLPDKGWRGVFARGTVRLRPKPSDASRFHVVLQVGLDDYTAGIEEVPASWPVESLRAQAIAARSYAVGQATGRGNQTGFSTSVKDSCWCHLLSTSASQVYAGYNRETKDGTTSGTRWAEAARSTNGTVVTYGGKVISTFYSSSTGGATDTNEDAWGSSPLPYLRSVPDPWSLDPKVNPNASWTRSIGSAEIAALFGFESLASISVASRNVSGTVRTVTITGTKNGAVVSENLAGGTVSSRLGLKSRYYSVSWLAPVGSQASPGVGPVSAGWADRPVLHDGSKGLWWLYRPDGSVFSLGYGNAGDVPFFGDWDCDGVDTPGLYRRSTGFVYLRNSNTTGVADRTFFFGDVGDVPVAGDFNGDGCDTVSIYRPSEARFYIVNRLGANGGGLGFADYSFPYGNLGDVPFVGDWNGDGVDTPGLRRPSDGFVYLKNSNRAGFADISFFYGDTGDVPFAGDWNGNGRDTVGLYRPSNGTVYLRNSNSTGIADITITVGTGLTPTAGRN